MEHKNLTKEQIIISLDRLTRFKNTRDKYRRVFIDILISSLIKPKFKKTEIEFLDSNILAEYVSKIFNDSLKTLLIGSPNFITDLSINNLLKKYENSIFINDNETQKLLNNTLDYGNAVNLIEVDSPVNLKWLKELVKCFSGNFNEDIFRDLRNNKLLKYPIEIIILVEGITEEILLPAFSKFLGYDFYANGVQIIAAGGKNQVVKKYYELAEQLRLPIFVLLDKDAEENIKQIQPRLRSIDKIHLVSCGEFEDLLSKNLIIKTVNSHFKNFLTVSESDFISDIPTAKILEEIYKTKGLHEFKKAEFAKLVKDNITTLEDVTLEISEIIEEIQLTNKMLDSKFCS